MDSVHLLRNSAIPVALFLVALAINAQQSRPHAGHVVEWGTGRPLVVDVKAWPESRETSKQGNCPLFGNSPLDSVKSGADGRFQLMVDAGRPTYTVTYCATDYYPRADRDIPNESPDVFPNPVRVYPRNQSQAGYRTFIRRETIGALNNLSYLRSINPDEFQSVVATLGKETGTGRFDALPGIVVEWGSKTYRPNQ
jgi:hypothetical protein